MFDAAPAPTRPAYRYAAVVTRVIDGDTLEADIDLGFRTWVRGASLRLRDVDCPERFTPEGILATAFSAARIAESAGAVIVDTVKVDKYGGRWDAYVYLSDGTTLNRRLIDAGHIKHKE